LPEPSHTPPNNPFAAPETHTPATMDPRASERFTEGQYLAGRLFLASAAVSLITMLRFTPSPSEMLGLLLDALISTVLVCRKYGMVRWAQLRTVVRAPLGVGSLAAGINPLSGAHLLIHALGMLGLLFGRPGRGRRIFCGLLVGTMLVLKLAGMILSARYAP